MSYEDNEARLADPTTQLIQSDPASLEIGEPLLAASLISDHVRESTETEASTDPNSLERVKSITYLNGLSLSIGLIIGSGIFASPSEVTANVGSPGASIIVWILAALLAWTGAASYAELGAAVPHNGGIVVYLEFIYGDLSAFVYTWIAVFVIRPVSLGTISIVLGKYTLRAILGEDFEQLDPVAFKTIAIASIIVITGLNCVSTKIGTTFANLLMWFKFAALSAIILSGVVAAFTKRNDNGSHEGGSDKSIFGGTSRELSSWLLALYPALWAYDGWDLITVVAGEMRNARRDLPRVIHTTVPLVMFFFVLANAAYFVVLPRDIFKTSKTIAIEFGHAVFGKTGANLFALAVSISCFGALNSSVISNGRLVHSSARKGYLPQMFNRLGLFSGDGLSVWRHETRPNSILETLLGCFGNAEELRIGYTPTRAMVLLIFFSSCYIIIGDFGPLLIFGGIAKYTYHFFTVAGLIVLRIRQPDLERPYRVWIASPILFCIICIFLVGRGVMRSPASGIGVLMVSVTGILARRFWLREKAIT